MRPFRERLVWRFALRVLTLVLTMASVASAAHPPFALLDQDGQPVAASGKAISTMRSCSRCHDTQYIATHSYHVWLGSDERTAVGETPSRRPWDWSPGPMGRWNPLWYRYLSPPGDVRLDWGTPEWIATFARHVGGGPALAPPNGGLPSRTAGSGADPERQVLDSRGQPTDWDWKRSGGVEMNCFLCHTAKPDNAARLAQLRAGRFEWANTATLVSTGLVRRSADQGLSYAADRFRPDGRVEARTIGLQKPRPENCGLCHGLADRGDAPLKLSATLDQWSTATKGQVFSPQRIGDSSSNLQGKEQLARAWDIHAERLLDCTSCHFSLNNPSMYEPASRGRPSHLAFEPRRVTAGEYLERPSHQFAKGHTAQGTVARHLDGTMRRCEECHRAEQAHDWLPYREAHFAKLSCEACHISQVYAPAVQQVDWTVLTTQGEPTVRWRGVDGAVDDPASLVRGFRPVLAPYQGLDGRTRLVPHNLVAAWYWVEGGERPRPVRLADLKAALLAEGKYHPDVARVLGDRAVLDTPAKVDAISRRLEAVGVAKPRIEAELQPYSLHHGVGPARQATRRCETCHNAASRLDEPFVVAHGVPGRVEPKLVGDSGLVLAGRMEFNQAGDLIYQPQSAAASLYVLGHNRWRVVDWFGAFTLLGVVVGVSIHAGLRVGSARKRNSTNNSPAPPEVPEENPHDA